MLERRMRSRSLYIAIINRSVYVNLVRDEYGFEDLMLTDHFSGNIAGMQELVSMWMMKVQFS